MRKSKPKKRIILPDPKYKDVVVSKFVNNMMFSGKKNTAYALFYEAIERLDTKIEGTPGIDLFKKALENVTPAVEVRSRRVGGANFQIPQPVREDRKSSLAMKWLIGYARQRHEKTFSEKLSAEILAACKEEGSAYKKKMDTHRMAEANKAFSHFRF